MFPMFLCDFYTVFMDISNDSVDFSNVFVACSNVSNVFMVQRVSLPDYLS